MESTQQEDQLNNQTATENQSQEASMVDTATNQTNEAGEGNTQ